MTQIDESNLDELDELQKECNINEYGNIDENGYYIFKRFREILATQIKEARIEELELARLWCAGGKGCEYSKLKDRLAQLRST